MKRQVPGLSQAALPETELPDGVYLVSVDRVCYRWEKQKPHYVVRFSVLEPKQLAGASLSGRLYCTPKALWKLAWFLRDFEYDSDLLGRDELDEKHLVGLRGVIKISHATVNGRTFLNLDAFAPACTWEQLEPEPDGNSTEPEVA